MARKSLATGLLTCGALLAPATATAQPSTPPLPPPPGEAPESSLVLSVSEGRTIVPVARFVQLRCAPPRGTHPTPRRACHMLEQAHGNFANLQGRPGLCPSVFAPVTVSADGAYAGRSVFYQQTFPNRCEMLRELGDVFRF